jgi:hypothetical protein
MTQLDLQRNPKSERLRANARTTSTRIKAGAQAWGTYARIVRAAVDHPAAPVPGRIVERDLADEAEGYRVMDDAMLAAHDDLSEASLRSLPVE